MLGLQGTLDPKTPVGTARALKSRLLHPSSRFVELPGVTHVAIGNSPRVDGGLPCGFELMLAFLQEPLAPLETACVDALLPFDFVGGAEANADVLGVEARWPQP